MTMQVKNINSRQTNQTERFCGVEWEEIEDLVKGRVRKYVYNKWLWDDVCQNVYLKMLQKKKYIECADNKIGYINGCIGVWIKESLIEFAELSDVVKGIDYYEKKIKTQDSSNDDKKELERLYDIKSKNFKCELEDYIGQDVEKGYEESETQACINRFCEILGVTQEQKRLVELKWRDNYKNCEIAIMLNRSVRYVNNEVAKIKSKAKHKSEAYLALIA